VDPGQLRRIGSFMLAGFGVVMLAEAAMLWSHGHGAMRALSRLAIAGGLFVLSVVTWQRRRW
jgi:uncharacterized membrane protein